VQASPFDNADPNHQPTLKERQALRQGRQIENQIRKEEGDGTAISLCSTRHQPASPGDVELTMTYVASQFTGSDDYPDGLYYFWLNGAPDNHANTRRCYSPELRYEKTLDEIGPAR